MMGKSKPLPFRTKLGRNDGSTTPSLVYMRKTRINTHRIPYQQPSYCRTRFPAPRLSLTRMLLPNPALQPLQANTTLHESNERLEERETRPLSLETHWNEFKRLVPKHVRAHRSRTPYLHPGSSIGNPGVP